MKIDNDFLTLMGLIADQRALQRALDDGLKITTIGAIARNERNAKIDALVAKINADHNAATKALMASISEQHDFAAQVVRMIDAAKDTAPAPSQPKGFTINGLGQMTQEWVHSPSADQLGTFEAIVGERPKSGCTYQIITDRKRAQEAVFERALELGFAVHISRTKLGSYLLRWDDVGEGR